MSPSRPDGVDLLLLSDLHDDVDVDIFVRIVPPRLLHDRIGRAHKFGVRLEILRRGHGDELDGPLVAQFDARPPAHGQDGLGGGHAVGRDEDFAPP